MSPCFVHQELGLTGSHVDSTAHAISPRCSSGTSPGHCRSAPCSTPCPATPMPRRRLDVIRCASFRTLLLPAGVETAARAVYHPINRKHYALVHRQPTFSLTLRVPCRNVGGHGEEDALALELERLAPNVMCSTQKNGIKLKGKRDGAISTKSTIAWN
jgi:hypothetical protein